MLLNTAPLARRLLAVSSIVLVATIVFAALLPAGPDGRLTGATGVVAAVVAGVALVSAWAAAIWHAAVLTPWTATPPRWLVIVILIFGTGVAGVLYYALSAHWQQDGRAGDAQRAA